MKKLLPTSRGFTLILAALVGMPAMATDMSLPALTNITHGLGAPDAAGGLTLTTLLAGFGGAQLLFGPLSDRFGRHRALAGGMALFTLAGLLCALSPNLTVLLVGRLLQGVGAAAGTVLAFAMVRDCFEGAAARRRLGLVNAMMAGAPVVAPTIGTLVLAVTGWRGIFFLLTLIGLVLWLVVRFLVPETLRERDPAALRPAGLMANYGRALRHPSGRAHVLIGALMFGDLFSFISGSPLVFITMLGLPRVGFALVFAASAGGLAIGSLLGGRLGGALGRLVLPMGIGLCMAGSFGLMGLQLAGAFTVAPAVALIVLNSIGCGMVFPIAAHGAIAPFPDMAGVASALSGSVRMAGGAVASGVAALIYDGTPLSLAEGMAGFATLALGVWFLALRHERV